MPRLGALCIAVVVGPTTTAHLRAAHARRLHHIENVDGGSEYLATGGNVFSMRKIRTFDGPRLNGTSVPSALVHPDGEYCEKWAVFASTVESTETVKQLGNMDEWCVVFVTDKTGRDEYIVPGVTYLSPADQEALPYYIKNILPWDHFGGKNIGYLYAVHHGAKVENLQKHRADFDAELPLYQQSSALVAFLVKFRRRLMDGMASGTPADVSVPERIESLAVLMYEYGIIEYADVDLSRVWLRDLLAIGYAPDVFTHHGASAAAGVQAVDTPEVDATARELGDREETRRIEAVIGERPSVLLVVAVISNRPEKREAIRNTWLAWADDRVVVHFFTEVPNTGDIENDRQAAATLKEEADSHGDLVMIEVDKGLNGVKLVEVMKWMAKRFVFDYFLRLDDDYFLCLKRLADDLEVTYLVEDSLPPPYIAHYSHPAIYVGHRYCTKFGSRIDEAYLLLSAPLVDRVLSTPDLQCSVHAGITTGWWFKPGGQVNQEGDVEWVNDPRVDHYGKWWQPESKGGAPKEAYPSVCEKRMAIHHSNIGQLGTLWTAAKDRSGPEMMGALFHYIDDGRCPNVKFGASDQAMINDQQQPCAPP